jgi:hypothetical protein
MSDFAATTISGGLKMLGNGLLYDQTEKYFGNSFTHIRHHGNNPNG